MHGHVFAKRGHVFGEAVTGLFTQAFGPLAEGRACCLEQAGEILVAELDDVRIDIAYGGSCTAGKADDLIRDEVVIKIDLVAVPAG